MTLIYFPDISTSLSVLSFSLCATIHVIGFVQVYVIDSTTLQHK